MNCNFIILYYINNMITHTFTFTLNESVTTKKKKEKLASRTEKSLLYSDEFVFGRNMTTTKPRVVVNKKTVKVTVELFQRYSKSSFVKAENKVKKYLNKYYDYNIEQSNRKKPNKNTVNNSKTKKNKTKKNKTKKSK